MIRHSRPDEGDDDDEFERKHIAPVQASRLETDAWEEPIVTFLANQHSVHGIVSRVTTIQVAQALGIATERLGKREQMRIAAIMRRRGWHPHPSNGVTWWGP